MEMTEGIYRQLDPDGVDRPSMDKHEETDTGEFPCETSNSRENLEAPSPQPSGPWKRAAVCLGLLCALLLSAIALLSFRMMETKQLQTSYKEKLQMQSGYDNMAIEYQQLQITYNNLKTENSQLQTSNRNLSREKLQLQGSFDPLNREKLGLQTRNDSLNAEKSSLQNRYNNLLREKLQLQTGYNNLTEENSQLVDSYNNLNTEKTHLQTSHNNISREKSTLQTKWDDMNRENSRLNSSYTNLNREKSELQASYNRLNQERSQLLDRYNNLTNGNTYLQTSYNNMNREKSQLQTSNNNLNREKSQLETSYNNLIGEKLQLETSNNNLTKEKSQLQTSYNNLNREKSQLQTSYNNLNREKSQLETSNSNLNKEKSQLETSYNNLNREKSQLQDKFHTMAAEKDKLQKRLCNLRMEITKYAVDVTLDPDTAQNHLILSADGKQVRTGASSQNRPGNPKRFSPVVSVLGKQGFTSGRFYYEVEVSGKTAWDFGVARESINRKGPITLTPKNGHWNIWLRNGDEYAALEDRLVVLSLKEKPERVGVFVDYEAGLVSFYDADRWNLMYSFQDISFKEKIYPYFSPFTRDGGNNSSPLIIVTPISCPKSQLQDKFHTMAAERDKLQKRMEITQYAVDVTLDPDTAENNLILSADGKQVRHVDSPQNLPDNLKRFDPVVCVLGKQGFTSGRFYYEVEVSGKTEWALGVARESINRKGGITMSPDNGYWTIWLRNGDKYEAIESPSVVLSLKEKPERVGVFVDYEAGLVSFYDADRWNLIYSFQGVSFKVKIYQFFSPFTNDGGKNSSPLIIVTPISCPK